MGQEESDGAQWSLSGNWPKCEWTGRRPHYGSPWVSWSTGFWKRQTLWENKVKCLRLQLHSKLSPAKSVPVSAHTPHTHTTISMIYKLILHKHQLHVWRTSTAAHLFAIKAEPSCLPPSVPAAFGIHSHKHIRSVTDGSRSDLGSKQAIHLEKWESALSLVELWTWQTRRLPAGGRLIFQEGKQNLAQSFFFPFLPFLLKPQNINKWKKVKLCCIF